MIVLPIALLICTVLIVPTPYGKLFHAELDDKVERLTSIETEKIVVVGGSSVAFGLRSDLLQEYMGMPVVNFGLYASLGTKIMLELSLAGIGEGDIVVIAPETDAQTMSLYFSGITALEAFDADYSLIAYTDADDRLSMLGALFEHMGKKAGYSIGDAPNPDGVYNSDSFNEYGDIDYPRPFNIMDNYYELGKTIKLDGELIDEEFFDYVNKYVAECRSRGAEVYYSFCPMNELAVDGGTSRESLYEFERMLSEALDCQLISYASDYILDAGYFYDTNYHLNETGAVYRTMQLAEDLMLATGKPVYIEASLPEAPELSDGLIILSGYDENEKYFTYEKLPSGNYMITGLTELGKSMTELTLPVSVRLGEGDRSVAVTAIGEGAFADGGLTHITVTENSELRQIMNGAFRDSGIKRLDLHIYAAETILPPTSFSGTAQGFEVHVPKGSSYTTDYYWSQVKLTIVEDLD